MHLAGEFAADDAFGGLDRAGTGEVVLRGHLEAHVATAESRGDTSEIVNELMHALKYT